MFDEMLCLSARYKVTKVHRKTMGKGLACLKPGDTFKVEMGITRGKGAKKYRATDEKGNTGLHYGSVLMKCMSAYDFEEVPDESFTNWIRTDIGMYPAYNQYVLIYTPWNKRISVGYYYIRGQEWLDDKGRRLIEQPTHWHHLPAGPPFSW